VTEAGKPLRVLLVSANYKPSVGGIERYVENLAHGLAARGHSITVAACRTDGGPKLEQDGRVTIIRMPATDILDKRLNVPYPLPSPLPAWRTLRRLISEVDVVHAHDALYPTSALSLALARRRRVPSVLTQHVAFVPQRDRALDAAQHVAIATVGRSARLATRVVTMNPAVADWVRSTWRIRDVQVLPPGVPEAPVVDRDAVRRALGLPSGRLIALFVGRDVPKKGLDVFLAAGDPAYDLVAITDRQDDGLPEGARALPFLAPDRFRALLGSVDAFVLPSEGEGFPLALQEALMAGLPCVIAPSPGYEHYLRKDEALLVRREAADIRTALKELAASAQLRRELGKRAREVGQREFGLAPFLERYERTYEDALDGGRRISPR
jgi:glycosyltransferase involved in cell wall biosynthesis